LRENTYFEPLRLVTVVPTIYSASCAGEQGHKNTGALWGSSHSSPEILALHVWWGSTT